LNVRQEFSGPSFLLFPFPLVFFSLWVRTTVPPQLSRFKFSYDGCLSPVFSVQPSSFFFFKMLLCSCNLSHKFHFPGSIRSFLLLPPAIPFFFKPSPRKPRGRGIHRPGLKILNFGFLLSRDAGVRDASVHGPHSFSNFSSAHSSVGGRTFQEHLSFTLTRMGISHLLIRFRSPVCVIYSVPIFTCTSLPARSRLPTCLVFRL